jgi:hypothetical protein
VQQSRWRLSDFGAAALRLVALIAGASVVIAGASALVALALHSSLNRAVSLGFYGVGALVAMLGLLGGNRGPYRRVGDETPLTVGRQLRRATIDELLEAINLSVLMVAIGMALLAIGIAIDDRYRLF